MSACAGQWPTNRGHAKTRRLSIRSKADQFSSDSRRRFKDGPRTKAHQDQAQQDTRRHRSRRTTDAWAAENCGRALVRDPHPPHRHIDTHRYTHSYTYTYTHTMAAPDLPPIRYFIVMGANQRRDSVIVRAARANKGTVIYFPVRTHSA